MQHHQVVQSPLEPWSPLSRLQADLLSHGRIRCLILERPPVSNIRVRQRPVALADLGVLCQSTVQRNK